MTEFCINCRKEREVKLGKRKMSRIVNGVEYDFSFTSFECELCGCEMSPPGAIDLNIEEFEQQLEYMGLFEK